MSEDEDVVDVSHLSEQQRLDEIWRWLGKLEAAVLSRDLMASASTLRHLERIIKSWRRNPIVGEEEVV